MNPLLLIWWTTVLLATAALLAMLALVLQRALKNRRTRQDETRRRELRSLALRLLEHPDQVDPEMPARDRRLLLQVYDELLPQIRGDYADRMVALMRHLGLMDECLRQIAEPNWFTRAQACRALGSFHEPQVVLALYRAVEDPEPAVRVEAARALAKLGAVRSVVELVRQVAPGDDLPSMQVMSLFRSLGRSAVPELAGLVDEPTGLAAKIVAADALGHIGHIEAVPALLHLYDHPSLHLRLTTIEALGRLGDPRALPAVLLCMTDSEWEVRAQAAAAAGRIGARDTIPLLGQLLQDEHWWVRYYAAEALLRMGPAGLQVLRHAASSDHPLASDMATGLLQEKGLAA
jgi:HEAT repeat protein